MKDLKILLTISILTIIGYFTFSTRSVVVPTVTDQFTSELDLSLDQARNLVKREWGDCREMDCSDLNIVTYTKDGISYIVAIYSGLRDDSVSAMRKIASVEYIDGNWIFGDISQTYKCYEGRGHNDFSSDKCL